MSIGAFFFCVNETNSILLLLCHVILPDCCSGRFNLYCHIIDICHWQCGIVQLNIRHYFHSMQAVVHQWWKYDCQRFLCWKNTKVCFAMWGKMFFKEWKLYWRIKKHFFLGEMWVMLLLNSPYLLNNSHILVCSWKSCPIHLYFHIFCICWSLHENT